MLPFVALYYPLLRVSAAAIADPLAHYLEPFAATVPLIHNVRIGREPLSYASYQVARNRDIPFVLTPVHHPRWKGWLYRAYTDLYKRADAVLALTEVERDMLTAYGVDRRRIHVIGMGPILASGPQPEVFLEKYHIQPPIVMFLGQHYPYKGYRQLLEAADLVWRKVPETSFVFAGPAVGRSERVFREFADGRIRRLGSIPLQTKTDALAACSLLCVPSTQESFGGVYTEAWSFAKPVIGCKIPAVAEVISDGVDGFLVAQDAEEIADRICYLLLNPDRAHAMGLKGQLKVQTRYTWERIAQSTEAAYQAVLGGREASDE
jgi:glycosyltransferase involved in cell wall biosynthesis